MKTENYTPDVWDDLEGTRPPAQSLDLQGHGDAINTLVRNYRAGRLHHAWLLSGPKGIGKATLAFRFAEYLLRNPDHQIAPEEFSTQADPNSFPNIKGSASQSSCVAQTMGSQDEKVPHPYFR